MQLPIYAQAVSELAVPKLKKFIDQMEDYYNLDMPNFAKAKASEKRDMILDQLANSTELRKEFVAFYDAETGNENDWSEWETAELPLEEPAQPETTSVVVDASSADAPAPLAVPQFVDGAFHQMVADVAGMSGEDAEHNLQIAKNNKEFQDLSIGLFLRHIQSTQHYITTGHDNMRGYIADRHPDMHYRKAMQLITNVTVITELGIEQDELKGVSWSSLREIVGILDAENYKYWLDAARSNTQAALIQSVKEHKAQSSGALPPPDADPDGTTAPVLETKTFNLYPEQKQTLNAAIEKAKVHANTDSAGAALDVIASAYTGAPPTDASIASVMPDLTTEGFTKMFTKINADNPDTVAALNIIFDALGAVWPKVTFNVQIPEQEVAAE